MYLHLLNDTAKELFLKVAKAICSADGKFSDSERFMLVEYCKEMNMLFSAEPVSEDVTSVIKELAAACDDKEKRIIVLELVGLSLADSEFSVDERTFLKELSSLFHISEEHVAKCEELVGRYLTIQQECNQLVEG